VVANRRLVAVTDTDEELFHPWVELAAGGVDVMAVNGRVLACAMTPK
jgi:hypothetical protein